MQQSVGAETVARADLWQQGVELMLFGMGTVFIFLVLLILATTLMSALMGRFFHQESTAAPGPMQASPAPQAQQDEQLIAVISAAVHKYRSRRKR
ncbi:MAG: OadG family protein [Halieaceae bacterium]|nr:OadG family protein [Halieaceae bacterium]